MQPQHAAAVPAEHFQSDMNSLMEELFETVTKSVNVPLDRLTQAERTRIIAQLHEQGDVRAARRGAVHGQKSCPVRRQAYTGTLKKQRHEKNRSTNEFRLSSCNPISL